MKVDNNNGHLGRYREWGRPAAHPPATPRRRDGNINGFLARFRRYLARALRRQRAAAIHTYASNGRFLFRSQLMRSAKVVPVRTETVKY